MVAISGEQPILVMVVVNGILQCLLRDSEKLCRLVSALASCIMCPDDPVQSDQAVVCPCTAFQFLFPVLHLMLIQDVFGCRQVVPQLLSYDAGLLGCGIECFADCDYSVAVQPFYPV